MPYSSTVEPAGAAVPFRVRVWGLPVALSTKVTVAVRAPVVLPVGENVAATVQLAVVPMQVLVILKSAAFVPPSVTDEKVAEPPEAVMVAVKAVLVVPMAWLPNVSGLGAMPSVGAAIVSLPILPPPTPVCSVNQMLPSGPAVMPNGAALGPKTPVVGVGNSTKLPAGVI